MRNLLIVAALIPVMMIVGMIIAIGKFIELLYKILLGR